MKLFSLNSNCSQWKELLQGSQLHFYFMFYFIFVVVSFLICVLFYSGTFPEINLSTSIVVVNCNSDIFNELRFYLDVLIYSGVFFSIMMWSITTFIPDFSITNFVLLFSFHHFSWMLFYFYCFCFICFFVVWEISFMFLLLWEL